MKIDDIKKIISGEYSNLLEEFSKTTLYSYEDWRGVCEYLMDRWEIIPNLHILEEVALMASKGIDYKQLLESFEKIDDRELVKRLEKEK